MLFLHFLYHIRLHRDQSTSFAERYAAIRFFITPCHLWEIELIDIKSVYRQTYSQKWTIFDKIINTTISEQKLYPIHVIFAYFRKEKFFVDFDKF